MSKLGLCFQDCTPERSGGAVSERSESCRHLYLTLQTAYCVRAYQRPHHHRTTRRECAVYWDRSLPSGLNVTGRHLEAYGNNTDPRSSYHLHSCKYHRNQPMEKATMMHTSKGRPVDEVEKGLYPAPVNIQKCLERFLRKKKKNMRRMLSNSEQHIMARTGIPECSSNTRCCHAFDTRRSLR